MVGPFDTMEYKGFTIQIGMRGVYSANIGGRPYFSGFTGDRAEAKQEAMERVDNMRCFWKNTLRAVIREIEWEQRTFTKASR